MFVWDFMADAVLGQIFDWIYGKLAGFFSEFFEMMNMMGAEL
ncbi:conjugal transfer protein TrbL family protein, partial [Ruthenibacterium lactatiformans]